MENCKQIAAGPVNTGKEIAISLSYEQLRNRFQRELNDFPMGFAYSQKQFKEMLVKLDCQPGELLSLGGGSYLRKSDEAAFDDLWNRQEAEHKAAMQNPEYVYSMFRYELSNHEYGITHDLTDTLAACDVTLDEVHGNPMWLDCLQRARVDYLDGFEW